MKILLSKFGTTLISRPAGKEAWAAFQPVLCDVPIDETIEVDFEGVNVLTPSWADEFLTPLQKKYKHVILKNTENPSVQASLKILEQTK